MANYLVFPDDAEQGVARHFSSLMSAKIHAGTLAAKRNLNVRIWKENLKTGIMQRAATVRPYYARKAAPKLSFTDWRKSRPNPNRGMRTYYRLESSMGGYLGMSNTLKQARKLAHTWSNSYGYAVNVFKAKRDALKETRGELVQVVAPPKTGRITAPASAWIPSTANPGRPIYEIYNAKTGDAMGRSFPTKAQAQQFIRYLQEGTSLKLHWKARKTKMQNPAGPSAIPSQWTPVSITRKGKQIQIRTRGR